MRWCNVRNAIIVDKEKRKMFDKKYIFSAKCAEEFELSKPIILLDDVVMADLESLR